MKKIFTLMVLCTVVSFAFAQKSNDRTPSAFLNSGKLGVTEMRNNLSTFKAEPTPANGPQLVAESDIPSTATKKSYTLTGNEGRGYDDIAMTVAVDGDDLYIQGLCPYFVPDGYVKGTKTSDGYYAFAPQVVGQYSSRNIYLGSYNNGQTLGNFYFMYDEENDAYVSPSQIVTTTSTSFGGSYYDYFIEPIAYSGDKPVLVEEPDGLEYVEYALSGEKYSNSGFAATTLTINVATDGNDVYFKGFASFLPDAVVKGTKSGNTVTVDGNQFLGVYFFQYYGQLAYFAGSNDASTITNNLVFTYDAASDTYTLTSPTYLVINSSASRVYFYELYRNVKLSSIQEVEAEPNPVEISQYSDAAYATNGYGYVVFNLPSTGTNDEALLSSKLYYKMYKDIEHEETLLTFVAPEYKNVTEAMTEVPATFDDDYDFEVSGNQVVVYLNQSDLLSWNRIGVQAIYKGNDVTHESEITWYEIRDYTTSGNDDDTSVKQATWVAADNYSGNQAVSAFTINSDISATVEQNSGDTAPQYYANGAALRLYGQNSLTITGNSETVEAITKIVFNFSAASYSVAFDVTETPAASPALGLDAPAGASISVDTNVGTWTGNAAAVTFTNSNTNGHARIQSIDLVYKLKDNATAIETIDLNSGASSVKFFDLQGRQTSADARGIILKQTRDAQGNVKTVKVINK